MFTLIAFGVVVLLLITALGLPYRQTWYDRWSRSD